MSLLRLTSGLEIGTEDFFKDQDFKSLYRQKNVLASEDSNQSVIYDYALACLESSNKRSSLHEFLKIINFLECEEKIIRLRDEHFKVVAKQMLEEKKLDEFIHLLGDLEQCVKIFGGICGREMVKVLIRIFEEIDIPPRAMCQALNAFLRRILTETDYEIWAEIERLIKDGKCPDISTHLALYPHFHKFFAADVILRCVEKLISSSAVERKESQNLFHQLIHNQNHPNGHQELPGCLEDKKEFLQLVMLLEENQQHIIDCQKGRFIRWLENKNCERLRLLPFSRSFNHENKKVVYSFCKLFLQNAKEESGNDEATRIFIINDFVPTTAQLTLFVDEETDENGLGIPKMAEYMKSFIQANVDLLPVIIQALASFNQSPTPLFYWIYSISKERDLLSNSHNFKATVLDNLVNIFYFRTQKHQLKVKSATQSLIVSILGALKIDEDRQNLLALKLSAEIGNPAYYSPANPLLNKKERQLCAFTSQLEKPEEISASLKRHLDLSPKNQDVFTIITTAIELYRDRLHLMNAIDERVTLSVFELLIKFCDEWDTIKNFEGQSKTHDGLLSVCAHHAHLLNDQQKASVTVNINSIIARRKNKDPKFVLMALKTLKTLLVKLQTKKKGDGFLNGNDVFQLLEDSESRLKGTTELAWQCAGYLNHEASVAECLEALSTCDITGQIAIALNLRKEGRVIDYNDEDISACMFTLWSEIQASFGNRHVHELYGHFCELLINKNSIANNVFEQSVIQPIFKEIQKKAITRHGMILPLLSQYTAGIYCSFPNEHSYLIIALLTTGSAFNKDVLVDLHTAKIVDHLVEDGFIKKTVSDDDSVDVLKEMMQVRRLGLQIIASLNVEKDANEKAVRLIHILIEEHAKESKRKPRYHLNSSSHLTKERCWQSILFVICNVLHENKLDDEQISDLVDAILNTLNPDEETSVRMFQSICLAKLIAIDSKQWQKFDEIIEADDHLGYGGAVSSVLVVGMLFCISVKCSQFTSKLIEQCIRLQQSNNFLIRIHAIATIKKLYSYCLTVPALKKKIDDVFPFLGRHVQFSHSQVKSGNMGRNVERVMGNLLFSYCSDVIQDLSLTGIFRTIPLSVGGKEINLINEELLYELYEESYDKNATSSCFKFLSFETEIDRFYKLKTSKEDDKISRDLDDLSLDEPTNVQQKITPWIQDSVIDKKSCEGLVICASLIDKANNLGGITRTAEVFGAESLAINNLSILKSKDYTSLAVTAMKWIDIQEVKAINLQKWLLSMKMKGYCLAGLEQTTNSISIEKFDFPKKCVVVLGNEREGIPTNIICLLDVVLEIPQKGIIRSLNVHVSAAISIWEYTRGNL